MLQIDLKLFDSPLPEENEEQDIVWMLSIQQPHVDMKLLGEILQAEDKFVRNNLIEKAPDISNAVNEFK